SGARYTLKVPLPRLMKILLAQADLYYPSYGGANKSNRLLLEALVAKGHSCCAVTREFRSTMERGKFQNLLTERGIRVDSEVRAVDGFRLNGVDVKTVWEFPGLRHLWKQIRQMN